ncbi:Ig-like domain-containing protein, partial [Pelotomaculum terephthalicicum JT]|uniref:Ig-like domain-containing protein n=1 Tax=Pelotomaculum terephthalicicum TaxID=206393 RepID=UPI001F043C12
YSSDNTAVATVNSSGTVTAVSAGTANITVTTADGGYTATCAVTVQDVYPATTMWLNKAVDTITAGATDQLTATIGTTGASQNVTWASSDTAVATVSDTGLVTAVAPGTANIIATNADGSLNATCAVTVQASTVAVTGVSLDKTSDTITAGGTDQLTATVAPADASNQEVTWASDNTTVATVDSTGLVTAVAPGTANITVTTADGGFTATCGVTVNAASVLTTLTLSGSPSLTYDNAPPTLDLSTLTLVGADQDGASYDISGMTVTWATVDASVSNSISGDIMTIYQSGNIFLTATVGGVTSNTLRIPIYNSDATTSVNLVVNGGSPVTVTAAQINALNTSGVLRAFSATKSNGATVYYTGLGASLADILSHYASVNSSQVQSIVVKASDGYVTSFPAAQTQLFNTRYYYPADGSAAQQVDTILATAAQGFVTSDPNQLDTVNTLRLFMGQANAGDKTANFCAKWVSEIDITVTVPVTGVSLDKSSETITTGGTDQLTATVTPADASNQEVTWASDNTAVATVDSTGLVTAVGAGTANITVTTADGGFTATCVVTVSSNVISINVTPASTTLNVGGTQAIGVTVDPADAGLSYASDNTSVATVSDGGVITAVAPGSAIIIITAEKAGYTTATASVLVNVNTSSPTGQTAPVWPAGSTVNAVVSANGQSVTLTWSAATDNTGVTGYRVYRNGTLATPVPVDGTSCNVTGLTAGTQYTFRVTAGNAAGNWTTTGPSVTVITTTPSSDRSAPYWPTGSSVTASGVTNAGLTLNWSAASDNVGVTSYRITRNGTQIATVDGGTSYNVTGLAANTSYTFRVTAGDAAGNWSRSSVYVTVTTP